MVDTDLSSRLDRIETLVRSQADGSREHMNRGFDELRRANDDLQKRVRDLETLIHKEGGQSRQHVVQRLDGLREHVDLRLTSMQEVDELQRRLGLPRTDLPDRVADQGDETRKQIGGLGRTLEGKLDRILER